MNGTSHSNSTRGRLVRAWRNRGVSFKAVSFAMVGVVNTLVDYGVFLLARAVLSGSAAGIAAIGSLSDFCQCGNATTTTLVVANIISWSRRGHRLLCHELVDHVCRRVRAAS